MCRLQLSLALLFFFLFCIGRARPLLALLPLAPLGFQRKAKGAQTREASPLVGIILASIRVVQDCAKIATSPPSRCGLLSPGFLEGVLRGEERGRKEGWWWWLLDPGSAPISRGFPPASAAGNPARGSCPGAEASPTKPPLSRSLSLVSPPPFFFNLFLYSTQQRSGNAILSKRHERIEVSVPETDSSRRIV